MKSITLIWHPSTVHFNELNTFKLDVLKNSQIIETVVTNKSVYKYMFNNSHCETYGFAVYTVNEAGISANSTNISVPVPDGE